jgi:hypothetical protein
VALISAFKRQHVHGGDCKGWRANASLEKARYNELFRPPQKPTPFGAAPVDRPSSCIHR